MTSEPDRLQYLDAMGLTAWVPRYQLPNARPSEACDWPELSVDKPVGKGADTVLAPRERFQALLGTPSPDAVRTQSPEPALGLQGGDSTATDSSRPGQSDISRVQAEAQAQAHWQFSLQMGCVAGRWLVIVPADQVLSDGQVRLLGNLFTAAGIVLQHPPVLEGYRWPPLQGNSFQTLSQDPGQDARDGLCAFISGRQRMGWKPLQVLVFGMNDTLASLLESDGERSTTLDLPLWLGPALDVLAASAEEKRALWPRLADWQVARHD